MWGPRAALRPGKLVFGSLLVATFLHAGLLHLLGNLLFLWVFGNNVEDRLGHVLFALFYLAGGVVASLAHVVVNPSSTVPLVGASGAIAAVMGAYLVWFPNARVRTLVFIFVMDLRAVWVLGIWFLFQFFTDPNDGVAWMAHVGGFLFGMAVALVVRAAGGGRPDPCPPATATTAGGGRRRRRRRPLLTARHQRSQAAGHHVRRRVDGQVPRPGHAGEDEREPVAERRAKRRRCPGGRPPPCPRPRRRPAPGRPSAGGACRPPPAWRPDAYATAASSDPAPGIGPSGVG